MTRFSLSSKIVCLLTIAVLAPACTKKDSDKFFGTNGSFSFSAATYSVAETGSTATITVQRTGGTQGAVTVGYFTAITGGGTTATNGADYTEASGTFSWAAGDGTDRTFTIPILTDGLVEGTERVRLVLINPTGGAVLGAQATAFLDILDANSPSEGVLQFEVTSFSVGEGDGMATITVIRTGGTLGAVGATFDTADGSAMAPGDYTDVTGSVAFGAGDATPQTFTVPITDDMIAEPTELLALSLTAPTGGAALGINTSNANLEIVDDDVTGGLLQFEVASFGVAEDGGTATITVTRTGGSTGVVTAAWATSDGAAVAPGDYTAANNIVTFPDGDTTPQTFTVTIIDDQEDENAEDVVLTLTNATGGAELGGITTALLAIVDNDTAGITVTPTSGLSTNEDGSLMPTFDVVLDTIPTANVDIVLSSSNGTEGQPDTFLLTFLPDVSALTPQTVTVTGQQDALVDGDIAFTIDTDPATSGDLFYDTLDAADVSLTNIDDDPQITIDDVTLAEGDGGTTNFVFTVTLTPPDPGAATTIDYTTVNGSASQPGDFALTAGILNIPPNTATGQITVPVVADSVDELDETFTVVLSNPSNGTLADDTGLGTITNDDDPTITITGVTAAEGDAGGNVFNFVVTLSANSVEAVSVDYSTVNGTADDTDDFTGVTNGVVVIPAGTAGPANLPVTITQDTVDEADESFTVVVNSASNTSGINGSPATGTITNDDDPTITITGVTAAEGDGGGNQFDFAVNLSSTTFEAVTVDYSTVNGTATDTNDFTGVVNGMVVIPAGTSGPAFLPVTITQDTIDEADESFTVVINSASNTSGINNSPATGTINNDDDPTIMITDVTLNEGTGGTTTTFQFTVSLTAESFEVVTFDFATADGTAEDENGDGDYQSFSGSGSITGPATSTTIDVLVNHDAGGEPNETFTVELTNILEVLPATLSGTGTITNDDLPDISITNAQLAEGNAPGTTNMVFDVSITNAPQVGFDVTVNWATGDFNPLEAQGAGNDYNTVNGILTWTSVDPLTQQITVPIQGDTSLEGDERFVINLTGPNNATVSTPQGVGTILNDDDPTISINNVTLDEGSTGGTTNFTFDVTLDQPTTNTVTCDFDTANGTATTGDGDYTAVNGLMVTFDPGVQLQQVTVLVGADFKFEALNETFTATLSTLVNANAGTLVGTGTINNDDLTPTISIADDSLTEGNTGTAPMSFTVSLTNPTENLVTFTYSTTPGSAENQFGDNDYVQVLNGPGSITAGNLSTIVQVTINGDVDPEGDEQFTVTIGSVVGANTAGGTTATGTITNDEGPTVVSTNPGNSFTGISLNTHYVLQFSETMDRTATEGAITVAGSPVHIFAEANLFFWSQTTFVDDTVTVVFNPNSPAGIHGDDVLNENTTYTVTVGTGALGVTTGLNVSAPIDRDFTTIVDTTAPMVVSTSPVFTDVIPIGTTVIDITFNENMDQTQGQANIRNSLETEMFNDSIGGPENGMTLTWQSSTVLRITMDNPLTTGDAYQLDLQNIQDTPAQNWANNLFFTLIMEGPGSDTSLPIVSGSAPHHLQANVARTSSVLIGFSERMNPSVVNAVSVSGEGATTFDIEYEAEEDDNIVFIDPLQAWPAGASITVTVDTTAEDAAGNTIASNFVFTFTTDAATPPNPMVYDPDYSAFKDGQVDLNGAGLSFMRFEDSVTGRWSYVNRQTFAPQDVTIREQATGIPVKGYTNQTQFNEGTVFQFMQTQGSFQFTPNAVHELILNPSMQNAFGIDMSGVAPGNRTFTFTTVDTNTPGWNAAPSLFSPPFADLFQIDVTGGRLDELQLEAFVGDFNDGGSGDDLTVSVDDLNDTFADSQTQLNTQQFNYSYDSTDFSADEPGVTATGTHAFEFTIDDGQGAPHTFAVRRDAFVFTNFPTVNSVTNTALGHPTINYGNVPAEADGIFVAILDAALSGPPIQLYVVNLNSTSVTVPPGAQYTLPNGNYAAVVAFDFNENRDFLGENGFGLSDPVLFSVP